MTVVAFKVFYDGTLFSGFTGRVGSIEHHLRRAISYFISNYTLSKASRTDPGVSAVGNVISVKYEEDRELLPGMLNSRLPEGLRVWAWARVDERFVARRARARTYIYVMPWLNEDINEMARAAKLFIGTHDLVNFQVRERGVPTVVTIHDISVRREGGAVVFVVRGRGFRNRMIRKIVNSIRMVGLGIMSIEELEELVDARVRVPIPPAPPYGLLLLGVDYGEAEPNWVIHWDGISYIINYLSGKLYSSLSNHYIILKILHEFMDVNKLFSHNQT